MTAARYPKFLLALMLLVALVLFNVVNIRRTPGRPDLPPGACAEKTQPPSLFPTCSAGKLS